MVKVLLTGALGNIGSCTLLRFLENGHEVTGFDVRSKVSEAMHKKLSKKYNYNMFFGDITSREDVAQSLQECQPDAIVHLAAIIPPVAYFKSKLSEKVNVEGTKILYEEAMKLENVPRFVFSSSYSRCGTHNPFDDEPLMTGDLETPAAELYGRQKQTCERLIKANYNGDYVILRFCRVLNTQYDIWAVSKQTLEFAYSNPHNQPVHGCHPRDVALACVNASVVPEAVGKTFPIGGDDSWKSTAGEFQNRLMQSVGIGKLSKDVHRKGNPDVAATWGFETHIDTTEAQRILQYQNITFEEYLKEFKKNLFPLSAGAKLVAPFIRSYFYKKIRYYKENKQAAKAGENPSEEPYWEDLRKLFPGTPLSFAEPEN